MYMLLLSRYYFPPGNLLPSLKRKTENIGNCNRKHQIAISGGLALEVAMDRSYDRIHDGVNP